MSCESRILIEYEKKEYGIVLPVQGIFVDKAKKEIFRELKEVYQDVFEEMKINLHNLVLYLDRGRTQLVLDEKMPFVEIFYGKIEISLIKSRKFAMSKTNVGFDLEFIKEYPSEDSFFNVDGLFDAGLSSESIAFKRLYCRDDTARLLYFLDNMRKGVRVVGPPGVGKSITVWFWACFQVKNFGKTVLWTHVSKQIGNRYILLSQEGCFRLHFSYQLDVPDYLSTVDTDIVIIDGITDNDTHTMLTSCVFSFDLNPKRQSISVASMAIKINTEDDEYNQIDVFTSYPWSLQEYFRAVIDAAFFESVKYYLTVGSNAALDESELEILIINKYYFAGCSARWMFGKTLDIVLKDIDKHFASVHNSIDILKGVVGEKSSISINHLMCSYPGNSDKKFFSSQYIAKRALQAGGSEAIRLAYGIASALQNPSFTGWIVEVDFIQQLYSCKGSVFVISNEKWDVVNIIECDMEQHSIKKISNLITPGCWLIPKKWNQGGYDLACLSEVRGKLLLRFVQVTNAHSHGLNLKYFRNLAIFLVDSLNCEISSIEIVIAIPNDIDGFSINQSMVKYSGALSEWKVGETEHNWRMKYEHQSVKVLHFSKTQ